MVVFDTSTLVLVLDPDARPPVDVNTGKPVEKCKERIAHLLVTLGKTPILIPTPVMAEFLVKAGQNKQEYLDKFFSSRNFEVGNFDTRAAIDCAYLLDGDTNKKIDDKQTKAKVKFDRQIVAIAKSRGAVCLYTDDGNLATVARNNEIAVILTADIPLPPEAAQRDLALDDPNHGN